MSIPLQLRASSAGNGGRLHRLLCRWYNTAEELAECFQWDTLILATARCVWWPWWRKEPVSREQFGTLGDGTHEKFTRNFAIK
ncbi:hypothetical protein EMIHUDRAFT_243224 [Emiliania huxleyi CCMP1516]|uniref:Uncharacterized protein n=2 Tax=Emiliania huxleyi TaxID=2903 RepID=A0A0D3J6M2_EMIH1|nr:hypothetical protein EMIHUDRAFT_243224 [Emiliania huxleyi CCMP1516]EOD19157.1 hypothetical protein EMIHUDRAFT_243224 [Emiliania huxleyi CCMP1516]|eukprot:XP_005771586.1 hypothetical protein EMIHUDRAFT_243224 [Emiliania huxleyi CCMP1516]